ncbi:MAG: hypothetical protein D6679_11205 [Candidatus Hydrogenedentota bacterium]|nr:MAG: hypothetical protein D6679_11205 [Candidatus Hydrogenedentota bacterium]
MAVDGHAWRYENTKKYLLEAGDPLPDSAVVSTDSGSRLSFSLENLEVTLAPRSRLRICLRPSDQIHEPAPSIELQQGSAYFRFRSSSDSSASPIFVSGPGLQCEPFEGEAVEFFLAVPSPPSVP